MEWNAPHVNLRVQTSFSLFKTWLKLNCLPWLFFQLTSVLWLVVFLRCCVRLWCAHVPVCHMHNMTYNDTSQVRNTMQQHADIRPLQVTQGCPFANFSFVELIKWMIIILGMCDNVCDMNECTQPGTNWLTNGASVRILCNNAIAVCVYLIS